MKKFMLCSTAVLFAATPAMAQSYKNANNVKSHDSTLSAATYAQPTTQVPAQTPPPPAPVAYTPPAAEPAPAPVEVADFSGPYIGAEGQYTHGSTHGFGGGVVGGFGWNPDVSWLKHAYLGAEAGFDWSGAHGENQSIAEHKKFNLSIRPGVTYEHVLVYGIAGYTDGNFKNNTTDNGNWLNGYMAGAGVQAALPHTPFKARLEYIYSNYQHASNIGDPHDNDIKIGLIYQIPVKQGSLW